jgi:hypothetical protein
MHYDSDRKFNSRCKAQQSAGAEETGYQQRLFNGFKESFKQVKALSAA